VCITSQRLTTCNGSLKIKKAWPRGDLSMAGEGG